MKFRERRRPRPDAGGSEAHAALQTRIPRVGMLRQLRAKGRESNTCIDRIGQCFRFASVHPTFASLRTAPPDSPDKHPPQVTAVRLLAILLSSRPDKVRNWSMASTSRGQFPGDDNVLLRPPAALYPDRQTFSKALQSATRSLSLAQKYEASHEATSRYELAYPLYLSAATGFLWAHKNISRTGIADSLAGLGEVASGSQSPMSSIVAAVGSESNGESARVTKLKETFMRQAKKALQRAERIREVKGAEWSRRWAGRRGSMDIGE